MVTKISSRSQRELPTSWPAPKGMKRDTTIVRLNSSGDAKMCTCPRQGRSRTIGGAV